MNIDYKKYINIVDSWINRDYKPMVRIHNMLYPDRASRVRIDVLGDMFPQTQINAVPYTMSKQRAIEIEKEYNESQVKSEKINTEVVTKYITTREIIKQRGEEQIRYIDREIVKYNEICKLPKEVISVHNDAAKAPK